MRHLLLLAVALLAGRAEAQTTVTSSAPDRVSLTVYRAPYGRGAMTLQYLGGFALVTETRRVRLPRGPAVLRFEGVAHGIVPVSAVIDGLPGGTIEKNRDARLLSPASLVDGTLGRDVTLTRTDRATGRPTSEPATIVAGPAPGVILRTATGIETLRCSGLAERLAFAGVPGGLSSKPALSVTTISPAARTVTVRLSYLASGFDWRASYVAALAANGRTVDLFAWLTLANSNPEVFPKAEVQAVAGRLNRVALPAVPAAAGALRLVCYPLGTTTSDLPETEFEPADEIVVTASRAMAPPAADDGAPGTTPAAAPSRRSWRSQALSHTDAHDRRRTRTKASCFALSKGRAGRPSLPTRGVSRPAARRHADVDRARDEERYTWRPGRAAASRQHRTLRRAGWRTPAAGIGRDHRPHGWGDGAPSGRYQ
ncbi:hypothetical protein [Sphingomonas aerolata]|uniref:DUF4139 domain-containing protein n=1 Tax=Sphingomonas aerolata TaxID=185951 RepID=UPI002FE29C9B